MQRLFGVSLALGAAQELDPAERERCRVELQEAVGDLRRALERPLAPLPPETGTTLAAELERAGLPAEAIEKVISLVDRAEYKRRQAPPGIKITPRAFGRDRRMPITNAYRPRRPELKRL